MKILTVNLPGREYDIHIGRGLLDRAGELCKTVLTGGTEKRTLTAKLRFDPVI